MNSTQQKIDEIASHYEAILRLIGEDPSREGLQKTPQRAAKALWFATEGYRQNPSDIVTQALFTHEGSRMIIVKDIEFYSFCEHHILPFFGKISVGYIPAGKMVGLSKVARLVNVYARRLQVQERLTTQVVRQLSADLDARGVIVKCTAEHLCMKMRGVEKQKSATTTLDYCGVFEDSPTLRKEFLDSLTD